MIATGANKADAVKMGVEGPMGARWPVSWLQGHGKVEIVVDEGGAGRGLGWETIEVSCSLSVYECVVEGLLIQVVL